MWQQQKSTGKGAIPLGLLEKWGEVAILVDSSSMEGGIKPPKRSWFFGVGIATPQTDRCLVARERGVVKQIA